MLDHVTDRHALPLIVAGQAQKDVTHNEALALIDLLVNATVVALDIDTPPPNPAPGQCWTVGPNPIGEWQGRAGAIAGWTASGWRFVSPVNGMRVQHGPSGEDATWSDGQWQRGVIHARQVIVAGQQVVGARAGAVAAPAGGSLIDVEARACLTSIIAALRHHGLVG